MSCENSRKLISTKNLKGAEIQAARTIEFNPVPGSPQFQPVNHSDHQQPSKGL